MDHAYHEVTRISNYNHTLYKLKLKYHLKSRNISKHPGTSVALWVTNLTLTHPAICRAADVTLCLEIQITKKENLLASS